MIEFIRSWEWDSIFEREWFVFVGALALAVCIPFVIGVLMLVLTGWVLLTGVMSSHTADHTIWGWVSSFSQETSQGKKHEVATVGVVPLAWWLTIVSLWIVYQLCELIAWPIRSFRRTVRRSQSGYFSAD